MTAAHQGKDLRSQCHLPELPIREELSEIRGQQRWQLPSSDAVLDVARLAYKDGE